MEISRTARFFTLLLLAAAILASPVFAGAGQGAASGGFRVVKTARQIEDHKSVAVVAPPKGYRTQPPSFWPMVQFTITVTNLTGKTQTGVRVEDVVAKDVFLPLESDTVRDQYMGFSEGESSPPAQLDDGWDGTIDGMSFYRSVFSLVGTAILPADDGTVFWDGLSFAPGETKSFSFNAGIRDTHLDYSSATDSYVWTQGPPVSNTARVVTAEDAVYESNTCEFTAQGLFAEVSLDDYREAQDGDGQEVRQTEPASPAEPSSPAGPGKTSTGEQPKTGGEERMARLAVWGAVSLAGLAGTAAAAFLAAGERSSRRKGGKL